MVRHIVMFKLKEFAYQSEKQAKMEEIKLALESLTDSIEFLRSIRVDFNINPSETWDLILTADLDTLEDVEAYANHPNHVAVSKNIIAPVKADRACVDFIV
ncbi:stress responsive protein [Bacteroidia bacterium]|nr:stress responsive protein [Bacteroidia bacterium]GHU55459.1 stress responsive protein [Bacteroidia bacterium]GHU77636.1 stress responsive protein [Bacteroidia bacterium]